MVFQLWPEQEVWRRWQRRKGHGVKKKGRSLKIKTLAWIFVLHWPNSKTEYLIWSFVYWLGFRNKSKLFVEYIWMKRVFCIFTLDGQIRISCIPQVCVYMQGIWVCFLCKSVPRCTYTEIEMKVLLFWLLSHRRPHSVFCVSQADVSHRQWPAEESQMKHGSDNAQLSLVLCSSINRIRLITSIGLSDNLGIPVEKAATMWHMRAAGSRAQSGSFIWKPFEPWLTWKILWSVVGWIPKSKASSTCWNGSFVFPLGHHRSNMWRITCVFCHVCFFYWSKWNVKRRGYMRNCNDMFEAQR